MKYNKIKQPYHTTKSENDDGSYKTCNPIIFAVAAGLSELWWASNSSKTKEFQ